MFLIVFCVPAHFARTPEFDSASHASHASGERLELFIAQGFHGWPARILCCYISCCAAAVESSDDFLFFTSMWQSSNFEFSACGHRGMSATVGILPVIRAVFALGVHAFLAKGAFVMRLILYDRAVIRTVLIGSNHLVLDDLIAWIMLPYSSTPTTKACALHSGHL